MALVTCPECKGNVSDKAGVCPHCGFPLQRTEYQFVEVYFDGIQMVGQRHLRELEGNGWQVVDHNEVVECEDGREIPIKKYKLQKTAKQ